VTTTETTVSTYIYIYTMIYLRSFKDIYEFSKLCFIARTVFLFHGILTALRLLDIVAYSYASFCNILFVLEYFRPELTETKSRNSFSC